jgi:hypothetical protein
MAKDNQSPTSPHRRNFLRKLAALTVNSAMPSTPGWVLNAGKATNPAHLAIARWLECHDDFQTFHMVLMPNIGRFLLESPSDRLWKREAQGLIKLTSSSSEHFIWQRDQLLKVGRGLLDSKPTYDEILSCFHDFSVKDTEGVYQDFLGNHTAEETAQELHRLSQLSPEEMTAQVESCMQRLRQAAVTLQSQLDSVSLNNKAEQKQLPIYRDMAAARKAGGYPVPKQCLGLASSRVGTHHVDSGEWRERTEGMPTGAIER